MPSSDRDHESERANAAPTRGDAAAAKWQAVDTPRPAWHAALLTAHGRGAIATIVAEGPGAGAAIRRRFRPATPQPAAELPRGRILFGRWMLPQDASGEADSGPCEELVVCALGADRLEIHCHGGRAVVAQVLESLRQAGGTIVSRERWLLGREPDRLCAEARLTLAQAPTLRVAGILLDQYRGALSRAVHAIQVALGAGQVRVAETSLRTLLAWSPVGLHLTQPWRIVIVGRANVGKSSLLNALLGYSRALVHPTPGTTRDVLTADTALDGWPVEFADTAGTRPQAGELERAGGARAADQAARADLILLVSDLSAPWTADDQHLWERAPHPPLVVHNKSDLVAATPSPRPDGLVTSAKTAVGIPQLLAAMASRLVPVSPPAGAPMPFRRPHVRHLTRALAAATAGRGDLALQALSTLSRSIPVPRPTGTVEEQEEYDERIRLG